MQHRRDQQTKLSNALPPNIHTPWTCVTGAAAAGIIVAAVVLNPGPQGLSEFRPSRPSARRSSPTPNIETYKSLVPRTYASSFRTKTQRPIVLVLLSFLAIALSRSLGLSVSASPITPACICIQICVHTQGTFGKKQGRRLSTKMFQDSNLSFKVCDPWPMALPEAPHLQRQTRPTPPVNSNNQTLHPSNENSKTVRRNTTRNNN